MRSETGPSLTGEVAGTIDEALSLQRPLADDELMVLDARE